MVSDVLRPKSVEGPGARITGEGGVKHAGSVQIRSRRSPPSLVVTYATTGSPFAPTLMDVAVARLLSTVVVVDPPPQTSLPHLVTLRPVLDPPATRGRASAPRAIDVLPVLP